MHTNFYQDWSCYDKVFSATCSFFPNRSTFGARWVNSIGTSGFGGMLLLVV